MHSLFRCAALPSIGVARAAPTLLLRPVLGVALVAAAFGADAQSYTDGGAQWTASVCGACHTGGNVPLSVMQAGRYATPQAALTAINSAIVQIGGMAQYSSLTTAQRTNLAYFISNFRAEANVSANPGAALSVSAVGQSTSTVVTLFNNGRAPLVVATNNGVRLSGTGAAQFSVAGVGAGCLAQTLAPNGGSCQVRVTYQPSAAPAAGSNHSVTLTIDHNAEPTASSTLALSGTVAAAPAPAPAPAPASSGGGGALPLSAWMLLLPAALWLRRRA